MALTSKKYEKFYETTGSGADKIDNSRLTDVTSAWATEKAEGCRKYLDDPVIGPLIYQLQQMQDEIDYLRTEIATNKAKTPIATGANTVVSFGDMVSTTVKGKTTYSIVMTVVFTDPVSSKVTTKTTILTLT